MARKNEVTKRKERIFNVYPYQRNQISGVFYKDNEGKKVVDFRKVKRTCILTAEQELTHKDWSENPFFYILVEEDKARIKDLAENSVEAATLQKEEKERIATAVAKALEKTEADVQKRIDVAVADALKKATVIKASEKGAVLKKKKKETKK